MRDQGPGPDRVKSSERMMRSVSWTYSTDGRLSRSATTMTFQGQTCVNTAVSDVLYAPVTNHSWRVADHGPTSHELSVNDLDQEVRPLECAESGVGGRRRGDCAAGGESPAAEVAATGRCVHGGVRSCAVPGLSRERDRRAGPHERPGPHMGNPGERAGWAGPPCPVLRSRAWPGPSPASHARRRDRGHRRLSQRGHRDRRARGEVPHRLLDRRLRSTMSAGPVIRRLVCRPISAGLDSST